MSNAVQVALATDRVGTPGKDGGAITLENVIAAQEVAAIAAEGFSIRSGSRWTVPRRGEGAREPANGASTRLTLRNVDGHYSRLDSQQCTERIMYDRRGDQPGVLGARCSPALLCWSCCTDRGVRTQRVTTTNSCATCPAHWRSARRHSWCDSIIVIKNDAALQ